MKVKYLNMSGYPMHVIVPPGYAAHLESVVDRRTGAATRRARDNGAGGSAFWHTRRRETQVTRGRRKGDFDLHAERRARRPYAINKNNPLGQALRRRKTDERRSSNPTRGYFYISSADPRVRALERRRNPDALDRDAKRLV